MQGHAGEPARCDVALEFLDVPDASMARLARLLGVALPEGPSSQPRVDEQQRGEVAGVEEQHGDERLLQPPASAPLASRFPNT